MDNKGYHPKLDFHSIIFKEIHVYITSDSDKYGDQKSKKREEIE